MNGPAYKEGWVEAMDHTSLCFSLERVEKIHLYLTLLSTIFRDLFLLVALPYPAGGNFCVSVGIQPVFELPRSARHYHFKKKICPWPV